jgi:hypothetical protein
MEQLVARKDGWVAVGWRKKDRVIHEPAVGEVILSDHVVPAFSPALAMIAE